LYGSNGNETFIFSKGDGFDTISNYDSTGTNTDRVQFVDVRSSEVLGVERVGSDLLLKYGAIDQVVVSGYFSGPAYKVKTFEFSDSVTWADADIRSRAITNGTSGDDTLWGSDGGPNHIFGLGGNDIIWGANGNDLIDGGTGNDQLRTGGGSDVVNGGDGNDWVNCVVNSSGEGAFYSYSGTATIDGDAGNDYLNGTSGDDSIVGGLGNDQLFGGDGNDTLNGGSGSDVIWGGNGNDLIDSGLGDDQISTGGGSDVVNGGDGNDWVNCVLNADGSIGYYTYSGSATIDGGAGDDYLTGTTGDDVVIGGLGDDHLSGHDGNDSLDGGLGDDNISGWAGNDTLIGGAGNDDLSGNEGDDSLAGGDGNDTLDGGIGNDTLDGGAGVNFVNGGDGNDTYVIHNRNTFIEDSGGIDTALVSVSFAKIPGSIENVQYIDGALKLPNWLDALTNPSFSGAQLTRMDSSKTFNFNFAPTLPSYQSASYGNGFKQFASAQIAYAIRALDSVANLIDVNFVQTNNSYALNTITFANNSQTDTWGYAFGPYEMFYGSDVFINGDVDVLLNPTKYADSFVGVFNHELGHALGLPHPHENTPTLATGDDNGLATIMGYSRPAEIVDFEVLDIAALQYIYGPSKKVRVGNDTYTVSAASSNFIWDGAGTDTLSASSQSQPVTLYLEPGYWGYIGSKATNITAAGQVTVNFGTVIENLIGGSGNDTLYGSAADNAIDGGAGNDVLYGGAGNDVLDWTVGSRGGNDTFYGGTGDDIYVLDSSLDIVIEYPGEGSDTIGVSFSYSIENSPNIENLRSIGSTGVSLTGNAANNILIGAAGNDAIDGGAGTDTAWYSAARSNFVLANSPSGFTVMDKAGALGTDTLQNIERIRFSDGGVALDTAPTQSAGEAVMLLGAVLPGQLVFDSSKLTYLGDVIGLFDQGYTLQQLSGAVMRLPIWDILTQKAIPTSSDIATYLLTNVNGAAPDPTTLANAVAELNTQTDFSTQGNFLWHLAETSANQTHVGLVGLASTGLAFGYSS
jgi:serralysin